MDFDFWEGFLVGESKLDLLIEGVEGLDDLYLEVRLHLVQSGLLTHSHHELMHQTLHLGQGGLQAAS